MTVTISVLLIAAVIAFASAAAPVNIPKYVRLNPGRIANLRKQVKEKGCGVNVCFAIDGSGSVGQSGFDQEKQFLLDMAAILVFPDEENELQETELAACQYGKSNKPITKLTTSRDDFNVKVDAAKYLNAGATQLRGGILYCFNQLRKRKGEANKLVLLGDGMANLGGNPFPIASRFRRTTGQICAIAIRYADISQLLRIVGGDPAKVLEVDDFFELNDIIDELVEQVCDIELD